MNEWILFLALIVAALSLAAAGIICRCCRRMRREKDLRIVKGFREQDRLARELDRIRAQKQMLVEVFCEKMAEAGTVPREQTNPPKNKIRNH